MIENVSTKLFLVIKHYAIYWRELREIEREETEKTFFSKYPCLAVMVNTVFYNLFIFSNA